MLSASALVARPMLTVMPNAGNGGVFGLSPAQVQTAYNFNQVLFQGGTVAGKGEGQTIAIVDAYNDPQIAADLKTFDTQFGVRMPTSFTVVNQAGSTTNLPATDAGWAMEESLDVEWAHAIAPKASIMLVEANSASFNDLLTAVNFARNAAGVSVVSMSWGANEFAGETGFNGVFTTPANHGGVTFVASSGDSGSASCVSFPAVAPTILAVGGTTLNLDSSGQYSSESGWAGSTGGVSKYEPTPAYQSGAQNAGHRTSPDVSYDANPGTGFAVYDSVGSNGGWLQVGGTSAGAPQWAALIAVANQGRAFNGLGSLDGATGTLPTLYSLYNNASAYSSSFHDVTSGSTSKTVAAGKGYDEVTGLGSPQANMIVQALLGNSDSNSNANASNNNAGTKAQSLGQHNVFAAVAITAPVAPGSLDAKSVLTGISTFGAHRSDIWSSDQITMEM